MRNIDEATEAITPWDVDVFTKLISLEMTPQQVLRITHPDCRFPDETSVLAIHWHPEMVPLNLVETGIRSMYPRATETLIIPTQHNDILTYGEYAGVEVDCRAQAFNRKIQVLLHFEKSKLKDAHVLRNMIAHTSLYRSTQLFEFMAALTDRLFADLLQEAAKKTGAEGDIVRFAAIQTGKLRRMIAEHPAEIPEMSLKNKLLINYLGAQRYLYDSHIIDRTIIFVSGVKEIVKRRFRLDYFYKVEEIIEEARRFGAGIIVPHPEQFWPVLLADYDVDGYEVWNPQSQEFTDFLIQVVIKKNMSAGSRQKPLLIVMGDDTHLSEKILEPHMQNPAKASREIGYQPAWRDIAVKSSLKTGCLNKESIIREYKNRLY